MGKVMFSPVSVCLSTPGEGYPHLANGGVTPIWLMGGSNPANGGYPHLANGGVVPPSSSDGWWGYPLPIGTGWGYPPLRLDTGWGYPSSPPLSELELGTPPQIRRQSSRASICYVAGSMPLASTKEDFLVLLFSSNLSNWQLSSNRETIDLFRILTSYNGKKQHWNRNQTEIGAEPF